MKTLTFIAMLFCSLLLTASGCEEEEFYQDLVGFELRLLNEEGEPANVFEESENITFSFIIINKTDTSLYLKNHCFYTEEFFKVYKTNNTEGDNKVVPVGKPYKGKIGCNKIGFIYIAPKDTLQIEMPWVQKKDFEYIPNGAYHVASNSPLSKGAYITQFSQFFKFEHFKTDTKQFKVTFEVQ